MGVKSSDKVVLCTDGATGTSNPGPISIGGLIKPDENVFSGTLAAFHERKEVFGTNNEAEYLALIHGLELAAELGYRNVRCFVDSQLIAKQVSGEYACKKDSLKPLHRQVLSLMKSAFDYASISWHKRDSPLAAAADGLSKKEVGLELGVKFTNRSAEVDTNK